jgi:predicted MFS family arabinose efflux permease
MFLAPAAMFAMFYFLSQYLQNVMGYSPLKTGVAFLPFTVGIVFGAGLASNLVNRIAPRYISGVGTLLAAGALFGFSRIPFDTEFPVSDVTGTYLANILPYTVLMAIGMGLTFVPVTLTAVHHLRSEESGVGSGVLNTMQQVGGALGLAVLATVATQTFTDRGAELAQASAAAGGVAASAEVMQRMQAIVEQQIFTEGSTQAFLVGSILMLAASAVIWIFLDVKHQELATDGPEGVHVG